MQITQSAALRAKAYLILGGLALAVLWGVTLHFGGVELRHAQEKISDSSRDLTGIYEAQMIHSLREIEKSLAIVSFAAEQQGLDHALAGLDQHDLLPPSLLFSVSVVDKQGRVVDNNHVYDRMAGVTKNEMGILERADWPTNAIYVGEDVSLNKEHRTLIRFIRRIDDEDRHLIGYAVVAVEPSFLVSAYDESRLGKKSTILLLWHDGLVLAGRTGGNVFWGGRYPGFVAKMANQIGDTGALVLDGDQYLDGVSRMTFGHSIRLFKNPLFIAVGISENEHLREYYQDQQVRINVSAILTLIIVLITVGAIKFTNRIRDRDRTIQRIQQIYHAASEVSPDASYVLDALHNEQGALVDFVVVAVNHRGADLMALSSKGLIGVKLSHLLPVARWTKVFEVLQDVYQNGTAFSVEAPYPLPSGESRWFYVQAVRVQTGVVAVVSDITSGKQAKLDLIQQNAELKALNNRLAETQDQLLHSERMASLGLLAAGVAHEINNPVGFVTSNIGALNGYIKSLFVMLDHYHALEKSLSPEDQARTKEQRDNMEIDYLEEDIPSLLKETKDGLDRVRKIVDDLKNFSRVDTTHEWKASDLHSGIESTLTVVHNEVKYRADVVKDFGDIPLVDCLPNEINQVIMNLVVNAAHAMGEQHGQITIRTRHVGDEVVLEVQDTGSGMSEATKAKIFDPFFTTKPVGKGTGLGLSLSYGIIKKHNGRIDVESALGQGSKFVIHLPVHQPAADAGTAERPS